MGVLGESWCFCNGVGKLEKMKAAIFTGKSPAMARVNGGFTGFFIHRNLLLTTHASLSSPAAAEAAEIRLLNGVYARFSPHRFFITSSVLDLTIVGIDFMEGDLNQHLHYLKSCSKANLELGRSVYLLGYSEKQELGIGEGKVVVATDNLIKLSTEGVRFSPGSAGFDANGNLAFMVCDPMKLATSPNTKSYSTSPSPASKRDFPMQFGIPIPIILGWLNQHWEGSLDDLSKPKLPLKRLMSVGPRNEFSCPSFTLRRAFKSNEVENEVFRTMENPEPSVHIVDALEEEGIAGDRRSDTHVSGIPTPEIYESPKLISTLITKIEATGAQVLPKPMPAENHSHNRSEETNSCEPSLLAESTGSVNGAQNNIQSNSSPDDASELHHEYSSEAETTMYSAETAESRNIPSPVSVKHHKMGRSQSCVNVYPRRGPAQRCSVARGAMLEKHRSRNVYSQTTAVSHRSNDFYGPTVSSIMKKRNNMDLQIRPRQSVVHTNSPRWMF